MVLACPAVASVPPAIHMIPFHAIVYPVAIFEFTSNTVPIPVQLIPSYEYAIELFPLEDILVS